jgi:hypothetical protein
LRFWPRSDRERQQIKNPDVESTYKIDHTDTWNNQKLINPEKKWLGFGKEKVMGKKGHGEEIVMRQLHGPCHLSKKKTTLPEALTQLPPTSFP